LTDSVRSNQANRWFALSAWVQPCQIIRMSQNSFGSYHFLSCTHSLQTYSSILVLRPRKAFFISTLLSDPFLSSNTSSASKENLEVFYPARILTTSPSRKSLSLLPTVIKSWYLSMREKKQLKLQWVCVRWPCWKGTPKISSAKTTLNGISIAKRSASRGIKKWNSYSMEVLGSTMPVCFAQTGIWWKRCLSQRPSRCAKREVIEGQLIIHSSGSLLYCNVGMGSQFTGTCR